MRIYLAGAITHSPDGGRGWREELIRAFPMVDFFNPVEMEENTTGGEVSEKQKEIILDCDGVLVYAETDIPQWGTPGEQTFAYENDIPNVVVYDGDTPELSKWCTEQADAITDNFITAMNLLAIEVFYR